MCTCSALLCSCSYVNQFTRLAQSSDSTVPSLCNRQRRYLSAMFFMYLCLRRACLFNGGPVTTTGRHSSVSMINKVCIKTISRFLINQIALHSLADWARSTRNEMIAAVSASAWRGSLFPISIFNIKEVMPTVVPNILRFCIAQCSGKLTLTRNDTYKA